MKTINIFGREPVAILEVLKAGLAVLAAFVIPDLSADVQAAIMAVGYAGLSAVQAFFVRPVAPSILNGVIQTTIGLVAYFGVEISAERTALLLMLVQGVVALLTRQSVTPNASPRPLNEFGAIDSRLGLAAGVGLMLLLTAGFSITEILAAVLFVAVVSVTLWPITNRREVCP